VASAEAATSHTFASVIVAGGVLDALEARRHRRQTWDDRVLVRVVQIVLGPLREPEFPIAIFERFVMVITLSGAAFG
jgi:hypothetical protein